MSEINRGSEWKKWDLHLHSPYTFLNKYTCTDEDFINKIINEQISCIGLTNYFKFDENEYNLKESLEIKGVTVFFNLELRLDYQNKEDDCLDLHVIFSNLVNKENIVKFLNNMTVNVSGVEKKLIDLNDTNDYKKAVVNFDKLLECLNQESIGLKEKFLIGFLSRGKGNARSSTNYEKIVKDADILIHSTDNPNNIEDDRKFWLEFNKPLLQNSDAHSLEKIGKKFTWIKANTTFEGLKQIIYEPEQRVKIQDLEPDLKEEKLLIDSVKFISNDDTFTNEEIHFNRNLNVIIGGKSSGKSILLYNIAKTLLADRKILKNENPPFNFKYDFGSNFDFEVKIISGISQSINRTDDLPSILSEIKYIPQNYLSKLAEPESKKGNELLKLVRGLLLEDEDYKIKYQEFINRVKSNDSNRESIINNYFEIQDKIESLKKDLILKGNEEVLELNIKGNNEKINKLKEGIGLTEEQIIQYNIYNEELEKIEIEIRKIKSDYSKIGSFHTDTKNALTELTNKKDLILNSLENESIKNHFKNEFSIINQALLLIDNSIEQVKLNDESKFVSDNIFKSQHSVVGKRKVELNNLLKPFIESKEIKKQIEDIEKLVIEDKQKLSVINQYKTDIKSNEIALESEKGKIFKIYTDNFEEYKKVISELEERTKLLESDNLKIDGTPKFNYPKLKNKILEISDGRKASYNNYSIFDENKNATSNFDLESFIEELKTIFNSMVEIKDYSFNSKSDIKSTVKILLDDYFFDYWEVIYDGDTLIKMSTGKASFVILMLIVGLSKSKAPILIDQPEDNLDNRSITKDLVEYLRNKKLDRQIILVTHNPNVVVNADAENVIIANQKGQNDKITTSLFQFDYINGSIENTKVFNKTETDLLKSMGVREHIADIVEGGKEAFKKREEKYGF